jgi:hypothetical protein
MEPTRQQLIENGITLDLENADEEALRLWSYWFNVGDMYAADPEEIRAAFTEARAADDFAGWVAVNEGPLPPQEEGAEQQEGEEVELSLEDIKKMNFSQLKDLGVALGMDMSDLKPTDVKVARERIIAAAEKQAAAEGGSEATGGEEATGLVEGTRVGFTYEGNSYEGVFQGVEAGEEEDGSDAKATVLVDGAEEPSEVLYSTLYLLG